MSFLDAAKELARKGFHVFPLSPGGKLPAIDEFPELATTDEKKLKNWWIDPVMEIEQPYGVAISSTSYNGGKEALLIVDVDNKPGKDGDGSLLMLEFEGFEFPTTCEQKTPTGGRHLIYRVPKTQLIKNSASDLGNGLDIRGKGGYIVGAGTEIGSGVYTINNTPIAEAPQWLIERCSYTNDEKTNKVEVSKADQALAAKRAGDYLISHAPKAVEGAGGDQTTFQVACKMRDFGLTADNAFNLMAELWNPECSPPWEYGALETKVKNAYAYAQNEMGLLSPENDFEPIKPDEGKFRHPFHILNDEFAFVITGGGGHILWETTDAKNVQILEHITIPTFHQKFASKMLRMGDGKTKPLTELWMKDPARRGYDGIVFSPGLEVNKRFYNLWRGFSVKPFPEGEAIPSEAKWALKAFLDHTKDNVCQGDEGHFKWLMSYFAHLIQKPWEKPLVALVFRGKKGVGKNVLVDQVGNLIKSNYMVTANRRYLMGNFNGHLENLLMFVLDEAFWSGDKQLEGIIKDLITGKKHVIERKGQEAYTVDNCARIVIIGNEDWVVPATEDERRYAVFEVGEGRKQDRVFFTRMTEGMEAGGSRLLLSYLMELDLRGTEINDAPKTGGLLDQKIQSLPPFQQWVYECLAQDGLPGSDFHEQWPTEIAKEDFRFALKVYMKERNIGGRMLSDNILTKRLKAIFPNVTVKRRGQGDRKRVYSLPEINEARKLWETFIGHSIKWEAS